MIDPSWLTALLIAASWTTFFSMFSVPAIRGYRNFGLLACYVVGVLMPFFLDWRTALATWAAVGVASGVLYFLYEVTGHLRARSEGARPSPRTLLDGLLLWPVMLPEVIENVLAEMKILKAPAATEPQPGNDASSS
jgi:hypothetical protein